jgi:predicted PurR-regulated permease PerM
MEDLEKKIININISTRTVVKIILFVLVLYFLYLVKGIIVILFISAILSSAIDPLVDWLQRKKIPRSLSILTIYLIGLLAIALIIYLIVPPIIRQSIDLAENFPWYLEQATSKLSTFRQYAQDHGIMDNIKGSLQAIVGNLENAAAGVYTTFASLVNGLFSLVLILVFTFYMAAEENAVKKIIWSLAPEEHQPYIMQLTNKMQKKIGLWLSGQLILSLIIFILVFSGLSIMGVKYALVLALIAGIAEFIPYLGVFLAAVPAIFLALAQSPMLTIFVVILYYIIHLVESNIIIPKLMQRVVGLNPIVIILALLIGFELGGVAGAILSIPLATLVGVFLKDVFEKRSKNIHESA